LPDGALLIFFVFLVTWAGDTGAYVAGKSMGRHALAPVISPKKTYEGIGGGPRPRLPGMALSLRVPGSFPHSR
jgi:CDP-diglyceride synthetase